MAECHHLPEINILHMDGARTFNMATVSAGRPAVIIYFDPGCEKCQDMTTYLIHYRDMLGNASVIFVSCDSLNVIKQFSRNFNLGQYPNFVVGCDYKYKCYNTFKIDAVPEIIIYNERHELRKLYKEEVYMSQIIRALHS